MGYLHKTHVCCRYSHALAEKRCHVILQKLCSTEHSQQRAQNTDGPLMTRASGTAAEVHIARPSQMRQLVPYAAEEVEIKQNSDNRTPCQF